MQKTENRFEIFFEKVKKYFKPIDFVVKVIIILLILFLILEVFTMIGGKFYREQTVFSGVNLEAFGSEKIAQEYFKELGAVQTREFYPYLEFVVAKNFHGKYINVDGKSVRKTVPMSCSHGVEEQLKIFVFGGSAVWGWGVFDNETISSHLTNYLCEKGISAEVTNFGTFAYVTNQERIKLELELQKGNYPDIVIFYDGGNDVYSAEQNQVAGLPVDFKTMQEDFGSRLKLNFVGFLLETEIGKTAKFFAKKFIKIPEREIKEGLEEEIVREYLSNIKIVKALEDDFGFKSFFYWQPTIFNKKVKTENEEGKAGKEKTISFGEMYVNVTGIISNFSEVNDLSGIFDENEEPIYLDFIHVNGKGNKIVAEKIGEDIINYINSVKFKKR